MRLIDADRLKINLYHNKKVVLNDDLVKCIYDTKTAYLVDKVVEELKELKNIYFIAITNTGDEKSDFAYENVGNALDKAIEIVKQGGIETDYVCEWKLTDAKKLMPYKTSCGNEDLYDHSYKYCPYCGKKIKVVVE